jgi:hypothetical protein
VSQLPPTTTAFEPPTRVQLCALCWRRADRPFKFVRWYTEAGPPLIFRHLRVCGRCRTGHSAKAIHTWICHGEVADAAVRRGFAEAMRRQIRAA